MTDQEKFNSEVQIKFAVQDEKINLLATSMEEFKQEMRDFKQEMREKDNQRAEEAREIRREMKELQKSTDEKFTKIDEKFERVFSQMQNLAIAAVVGVGAIVATVVSIFK